MKKDAIVVVLAAGEGTRMKSKIPKVIHKLCGTPIINYCLETVKTLNFVKDILVVLGYKEEEVRKNISSNLNIVIQREQLGTGHALIQVKNILKEFSGEILVLPGDSPLITKETLERLYQVHKKENAITTILTAILEEPQGYGRIVRDKEGRIIKIVEELDATSSEKKIKEINSSIYIFNWNNLKEAFSELRLNPRKGEYYLTDCIEILINKGLKVTSYTTSDSKEVLGINNRIHLSEMEKILRRKILEELMLNGVTILDPDSTFIDKEVIIEPDTIIYPYTSIMGKTKIKNFCVIGPFSCIINSQIENNATIFSSFIINSHIMKEISIGPYNYYKDDKLIK